MKQIDILDSKQFKQIIKKIFLVLAEPIQNDTKLLKGMNDIYSVSMGEYIIIYSIHDLHIEIEYIAKRNDDEVYDHFKRKMN